MTKSDKAVMIEELKEKFNSSSFFYITDSSELTVEQVNKLRGMLYEKGVEMRVVKNTLAKKALEGAPEEKGYGALLDTFIGPTALMFTQVSKSPAQVIKEFRKGNEKPLIKAAYIDTDVFLGDDQLDTLTKLKSKEDLLGDIITILQSPIKNVLGSLQSGGQTLASLLKALEEKAS